MAWEFHRKKKSKKQFPFLTQLNISVWGWEKTRKESESFYNFCVFYGRLLSTAMEMFDNDDKT